jgi:hypothetical protein
VSTFRLSTPFRLRSAHCYCCCCCWDNSRERERERDKGHGNKNNARSPTPFESADDGNNDNDCTRCAARHLKWSQGVWKALTCSSLILFFPLFQYTNVKRKKRACECVPQSSVQRSKNIWILKLSSSTRVERATTYCDDVPFPQVHARAITAISS